MACCSRCSPTCRASATDSSAAARAPQARNTERCVALRHRWPLPAVWLVLVTLCGARIADAGDSTPARSITSDERIQTAIERAARAQTDDELAAELRALGALGGPNHRDLLPQLVVFTIQQHDTRAALIPGVIRERLAITDTQLVEALLPYLETPDPQQRAQLRNWLGGIDTASGDTHDFTLYRTIIAARRDDPPLGLVRYMYETDADTAALTLADVYAEPARRRALVDLLRPVRQARASDANGRLDAAQTAAARDALKILARDPTWWTRLYAAAALAQMRQLRTADLVELLQADRHPLVRDMVRQSG